MASSCRQPRIDSLANRRRLPANRTSLPRTTPSGADQPFVYGARMTANAALLLFDQPSRPAADGRQEPAANGSFIAAQLADRCASERTFGSSSPLPHGPDRIRFSAARTAAHPTPPVPGSGQRSSSTPRGADSEAHSLPCATKQQRVKPTAKHLGSFQRRPERTKSHFQHAPIRYAACVQQFDVGPNNGFFASASAQYRTESTRIDQVDTDRCDLCKWPADVRSISLNQRKPASPS